MLRAAVVVDILNLIRYGAAAIRSLSTSLRQQLVPSLFRCYLATFYYRLNGSWLPGEINYDGQRLKSSQRYGHQRDCSVSLAPLNTQTVHLADGKQRLRGGVSDRRHLHPLRSTNPRNTIRYDTRCYFNVRSKANMSQLNLPHGTDN